MERSLTQRGLSPRARPRARGLRARTGSGALSRRAARSLDADVCLATYLSVQTLERERRSMVMRPALREQERRLRLFLRRKEEARRTWGWSSGSSPAPCALNGTILVTAAGQSTSTSSAASTRPSSASTCRSRRPCRVLPSPPPRAQAHRHRPRSKQLGAQRSAERACWSMSRRRRLPLAVKS